MARSLTQTHTLQYANLNVSVFHPPLLVPMFHFEYDLSLFLIARTRLTTCTNTKELTHVHQIKPWRFSNRKGNWAEDFCVECVRPLVRSSTKIRRSKRLLDFGSAALTVNWRQRTTNNQQLPAACRPLTVTFSMVIYQFLFCCVQTCTCTHLWVMSKCNIFYLGTCACGSLCTYCPLRCAGSPRGRRSARVRVRSPLLTCTGCTVIGPPHGRQRFPLRFPRAYSRGSQRQHLVKTM